MSRFVEVDGHHLHTVSLGVAHGMPLLAHGGWVAAWELWLPTFSLLQERWRCLAYDHRGAGASTFPTSAITAGALVDDVFRVLDAHDVERCVLVGESLGTLVCLDAALRDPARFAGLVLIGGFPALPGGVEQAAYPSRTAYLEHVAAFVDACVPEPDMAHVRRFGRGLLAGAEPEAATRMTEIFLGAGHAPALGEVRTPTLVIHGALDAIAPLAGGEALARAIPDAELVVLDDAGHVPPVTRPQRTAAAIERWWDRVGATRGGAPPVPAPGRIPAR